MPIRVDNVMAAQQARVLLATKKIAFEALRRVIQKSPVDTGRFKGNWNVGLGATDGVTTEITDPSGAAALASGLGKIQNASRGTSVHVSNSLPYAQKLEEGYSKQAPTGMVALTAQELKNEFKRIVR